MHSNCKENNPMLKFMFWHWMFADTEIISIARYTNDRTYCSHQMYSIKHVQLTAHILTAKLGLKLTNIKEHSWFHEPGLDPWLKIKQQTSLTSV